MTNSEVLENIVNECPFEFHELKHLTTHDERNNVRPFFLQEIKIRRIANSAMDYTNGDKILTIFDMQRCYGLKYDNKSLGYKSPLNEWVYFKIIYNTLLYDIE